VRSFVLGHNFVIIIFFVYSVAVTHNSSYRDKNTQFVSGLRTLKPKSLKTFSKKPKFLSSPGARFSKNLRKNLGNPRV